MKINRINPEEIPLSKILSNVERYMDKSHINSVKPEAFAYDLFLAGEKCNTPEKSNLLNNCLTVLADKMLNAKQDNLAGIIYSFLIKFNNDNPIILKQLIPKSLKIAKMQKDSVHVAARTGELCNLYKAYQIHGSNYMACLALRKKALSKICSDYDAAGKNYRTISRQMNKKDTYIELLVRTKCDIAEELRITNKHDARKELLSAYNDMQKMSEKYRTENEKTYCGLKKYINIELTNITLCKNTNFNNPMEKFSNIRRNIIEATKENAPIENSLFDDCFASLYDEFKQNSYEDKFVYKSLQLTDELVNLGNFYLADRICNILTSKTQDNIKNLKSVILKQQELREKNNDDFGVLYFHNYLKNLCRKNIKAVTFSSLLKSLQSNIKALTNIIENYDSLSERKHLKPKNEYLKYLIFSKIDSAKLLRKTKPEYSKATIKEAANLLEKLPLDFITEHPEIKRTIEFIRTNIDSY